MHNKTYVSAIGWFLSVGGWFLWTLVLSAIFKPTKTYPLYPIYQDFLTVYGRNLAWWLVLFLTLAALILFELGVSSIRKTFWPTDTDVFQELQKDPIIRKRFEETVQNEKEGNVNEVEMGREKKTSSELQREGEIQDLLDRPRVMDGVGAIGDGEPVASGGIKSASGSLHRRRVSTDINAMDIEMSPRTKSVPKFRHSVDIAEVLGERL